MWLNLKTPIWLFLVLKEENEKMRRTLEFVAEGTTEGESEGVTGEGDVVAGTGRNSDRARWVLKKAKVKRDQNP